MGLYDYQCMISGVSLRASEAVLLIMEPTLAGPVPAALGIKGTYNRLGSVDMFPEDSNCERIFEFFSRNIESGQFTCDEEYFPFGDTEQFLECLTAWGNPTIMCDQGRVVYTLICRTIWDAIVDAAPPTDEEPQAMFRRIFQNSTFAQEIYGDDIDDVEQHVRELAAITDFLTNRSIAWADIDENSARQHNEHVGQYLEAARQTFADSPELSQALDVYERDFRKRMNEADSYLGPIRDGFVLHDADDNDDVEDESDEETVEEDPNEATAYQTQEFIFYLGNRQLGSFLMPVHGDASPEPITRRLVTAPTKTDMLCTMMLLWVEETENGAETMIWNADTPEEMTEAQRLYDAAHGIGSDDETAEYIPVERSPEERQLLQAVSMDFDNDVPLLKYADWLTAQGNPQGEFIRVDLEITASTQRDQHFDDLNKRWFQLLSENAEKWFEKLASLQLFPYQHYFWMERGVIYTVDINRPDVLLKRADALFDAAPLLQTLVFDCEPFNVAKLATIPQLSQITKLEMQYLDVEPNELSQLLKSPYLGRLTGLELNGNPGGSDLARAIVDSPVWPRLKLLNLSSCELDDDAVEFLATGEETTALEMLDLESNELSSASLSLLGRSTNLKNLRSLGLGGLEMTADGVAAMANAPILHNLEEIILKSCKIDEGIAAELAKWNIGGLKKLNLSMCDLDDESLTHLLQSQLFSHVEELNLYGNKLTNKGVVALVQSPVAANLVSLDLSRNPFDNEGVEAIANAAALANVSTLQIYGIELGPKGVESLVSSPYLTKIESLAIPDEIPEADKQRMMERFGESISML